MEVDSCQLWGTINIRFFGRAVRHESGSSSVVYRASHHRSVGYGKRRFGFNTKHERQMMVGRQTLEPARDPLEGLNSHVTQISWCVCTSIPRFPALCTQFLAPRHPDTLNPTPRHLEHCTLHPDTLNTAPYTQTPCTLLLTSLADCARPPRRS